MAYSDKSLRLVRLHNHECNYIYIIIESQDFFAIYYVYLNNLFQSYEILNNSTSKP